MNKSKKLLAVISCGLLAILNSCKDNTGNLSPNVLPKSDIISAYQTDADTIVTSMYLKDSVLTEAASPSLLGSYNDPIFGESKASIYTAVYPSGSTFTYPTYPPWTSNSKVDSVVLLLQFNTPYYGSSDPQTFVVYQTNNNIASGYPYYSNSSVQYNSTPIGEAQVTLPPNTNVTNDSLRIPLSKTWWNNFSISLESNSYWTSNFSQLLKGLYITTSTPLQLPGQGSLINVNLSASFSGIYLYYHHLSSPGQDSVVVFPIGGSSGAFFTHFDHNYSTSYLGSTHPTGEHDSISAAQLMYLQTMGGVIGRINFPNLYKNWAKLGHVIINEAIITLPIQPPGNNQPSSLFLLGTDSIGGTNGNLYYQSTPNGNSYTFIITPYIQSVINGKIIDRGLYVIPTNEATTANNVVLYGARHGTALANRASLTIYYTPVKN